MSSALRRLAACVALVAFAATLSLPLVSPRHLSWNDDPDCSVLEVGPRHTSTTVGQAATPIPGGHCALCHWLRAFAGASPADLANTVAPLEADLARAPETAQRRGRFAALDCPSRAPPSISL